MQNKIIRTFLYVFFFLLFLVYFLIQGFPVELIGQRMSREVELLTNMRLSYSQIDSLFPNGIELNGVKLTQKNIPENITPISVQAERLSARISLLSLMTGKVRMSLSSNLLSGNVDATASMQDGKFQLKADLNGLELANLGFLSDRLGQEVHGRLHGNIDLDMPSNNIRTIKGELLLQMEQGKIGNQPLKIQLPENVSQFVPADLKEKFSKGIKIPFISLGKSQGKFTLDKGKLSISDFQIESDDIAAHLEGYFQLQARIQHAIAHLTLRFKPSEAKIKEIISQLPSQYQDLAQDALNSELSKAKGNDGFYRYKIDGRLFSPHTRMQSVFKPVKM